MRVLSRIAQEIPARGDLDAPSLGRTFAKGGEIMLRVAQSIAVEVPAHRAFDYLTRPAYLPEVWPSMIEVTNVHRTPDGSCSFEWVKNVAGVRFKGHTQAAHVTADHRVIWKTERGLPSLVTWTFTPCPRGTELGFTMDYVIPAALAQQLDHLFVQECIAHDVRTLLENVKVRLELAQKRESLRPAAPVRHLS